MVVVAMTSTSQPVPDGAVASPTPRRIARPRWLDPRLLGGLVLIMVAALLAVRLLTSTSRPTESMWVTARALPAGTVLGADDVRPAPVRWAGPAATYLPATTAILGRTISQALVPGELVPAAALTAIVPEATITVVLAPENAPALARGEHVELWVTAGTCRGVPVLGDVVVQSAQAASSTAFATGRGQSVTVRVSLADAARLTTAVGLAGAALQAGIVAGAAPVIAPPDLSGCAGKRG
jgi:hypothetical protein